MEHPELDTPSSWTLARRSRSCWRPGSSLIHLLVVVVVSTLAVGCENGPSEPEEEPVLSLTLTVTSVVVNQGEAAHLTGTATVGGSFVGSPEVSLLGLPEGVTGTVGVAATSGSTTTVPVTIEVAASAPPGTFAITARASGSGVSDEVVLSLTVRAAPRYTLEVAPAGLTVERGASGTAAITLTRTNFEDEVSLTAEEAPGGMDVSFVPMAVAGDASELTVAVDGSVPEGTYHLTIRGTAPGLDDRTATLQVEVEAGGQPAYTLSVTPNQLTLDPAQPELASAGVEGPAGASTGQVTVEVTRTDGHAEPVVLELAGQPEGITATFDPPSVSGAASTLTVSVGATVEPGEYETTVRGRDGGLPERTTPLLLLVTPTPSYQLQTDPKALALEKGTSGTLQVLLNRTDFAEEVSLTVQGAPMGMEGSFTPNPAPEAASTLTLQVGEEVLAGDYEVTILGTTTELADRSATVTVTVREPEGFSLGPVSEISIQQGASDSRTVPIERTGDFAGEVTVGVTPVVSGLTLAVDPQTTTGDGVTLTATASATVAPGTYSFDVTGTAADEPAATTTVDVTVTPLPSTITVRPVTIDDILYNPGMGFTDSPFGYGYKYPEGTFESFRDYENPPPYPEDYPPSTVAYFRWCWNMIEPSEGQIDFARFDKIIENGALRSEGERLGFRIITMDDRTDCMPDWLLAKPGYVGYDGLGRHVPDYGNPVFLAALERLYGALGARYDGQPGIDHIDLGIVGCWGEWNSACLSERPHLCEVMGQSDAICLETFRRVLDVMIDAFPETPKIMLGKGEGVLGAAMDHALDRGAGWRVDCFGDWGIFGPDWNHHEDAYPQVVSRVGDAWKRGPVHMEVCFTMPHMYYEFDMSVELVQRTFDWALDNHISVFNGKSTPVPEPYEPIVEEFLKKAGYRLVIDAATHPARAAPGQDLVIETVWKNLGVAPPYLPHRVAFRLRDTTDRVVVQGSGDADILGWLPGNHAEADVIALPGDLAPGSYSIDVAILGPDAGEPAIDLAIEGRRPDGWYPLSVIRVE